MQFAMSSKASPRVGFDKVDWKEHPFFYVCEKCRRIDGDMVVLPGHGSFVNPNRG